MKLVSKSYIAGHLGFFGLPRGQVHAANLNFNQYVLQRAHAPSWGWVGPTVTACTLLSIIGKRFQDAGLRDLCVESGVTAEGSVVGVLDARRYNRGVILHKIMYEALMRLAWQRFVVCIQENQKEFQDYC